MGTADDARKSLQEDGEPVTITFPPIAPAFDPITGVPATPTAGDTYTAWGYPGAYSGRERDGTVIKAGDVRLTCSIIATRPVAGCMIEIDGQTYRAMDVRTVREAAQDVLYIIQCRRS